MLVNLMTKNLTEKSILKQIDFLPDPGVAKYKILWDKGLCLKKHY